MRLIAAALLIASAASAAVAGAQTITQRGFVETQGLFFPQEATNDSTRVVGDVLVRDEAFLKPVPWIQFAAGVDFRANSHDQVEDSWQIDFADRTIARPRLSIRRLSATVTRRGFTLDLGKQFIRWGKTDIVTPTDRFAPRDFLNVFENEFLAVTGVRASAQAGTETFEAVWVPRLTPSRIPLLSQRWTVVSPEAAAVPIVDVTGRLPEGSQFGVRWSHTGSGLDASASFFDGDNHLPTVDVSVRPAPLELDVARIYPAIRSYGADAAVPLRWMTIKAETAYVTSPSPDADEYVLYVVQLERQIGEWVLVGGYAGEVVTERRTLLSFAPDRGVTRAIVGRASYTIDPNRSAAFEGALRQNGAGAYLRAEYSQARGAHWRTTVAGTLIRGRESDFIGQYRRNSHFTLSLRYSF